MRVVGLSATVFRTDTGRLDQGEGRLFDKVVYSYGIGPGIRDGWLSPLTAKATRQGEIDVSTVGRRGGEFIAGQLESAADTSELVEGAVREIIKRGANRRSWLAFCSGVGHAFHVRDVLRRHGVLTETIVGTTPGDERRQIIEDFRAGRITCLSSVGCLTTGFDVHGVDLIAMLRPTLSPGLFVQMCGRGTRKADGKTNCLILDFAGNTMLHGPVDLIDGAGCGGERERQAAPVKECPECETLVATAVRVCPVTADMHGRNRSGCQSMPPKPPKLPR
jgi:DNA repair protein RadD